jgi:hypothetical protein
MNEDWEKACWMIGSALLGFTISEFRNWWARRRSRFDAVVDRYVAEVRDLDDPDIRLLAMQRAGIASLTNKNFKKFISEVMARGCVHPYRDTMIDGVIPEAKIPAFIHEATQNNVPLADKFEVLEYFRQIVINMPDRTNTPSDGTKDGGED